MISNPSFKLLRVSVGNNECTYTYPRSRAAAYRGGVILKTNYNTPMSVVDILVRSAPTDVATAIFDDEDPVVIFEGGQLTNRGREVIGCLLTNEETFVLRLFGVKIDGT